MAKLKITNRYGITPNIVLNNTDLTLKAKGLYAYIQSKPETWDFAVSRIAYDNKDGIDGINTGLKELEKVGLLERRKFRTGRGHWDIEYILYEEPTIRENPQPATIGENPTSENPTSEKPETNKEGNTNKEISNKKYFEDHKLNITYLEFIEHRKQLKQPMTALAITKSINQLNKWLDIYKLEEVIGFIDLAIANGWKGIFNKKVPASEKKLAYESEDRSNFSF